MAQNNLCPICAKRRLERFCRGQGEKICAVCCGTQREVTLDCPADCAYLITAHRYEHEHRKPLAESDLPFPDMRFPQDVIYARQPLLAGLGHAIVKFAGEQRDLADPDALAAITALAETFRTLVSGIYYEKPPDARLANGLYGALASCIQDYKKQESEGAGLAPLKDTEVFHMLVFLARAARSRTNERPRARIFLEFLRAQFPQTQAPQPEPSRIIIP